ncbi:MAG: tRNA 4-thiouridine(8) synthase ThiI [Spirochaetota bacterium]|nr:tRNA 4-thiouridine(8) synthase ThiI [Spirochaetota bacterium]
MKYKKGILLYSGGLDSLLAAQILMEQDIEIIGVHFVLPFVSPHFDLAELPSSRFAKQIGLPIIFFRCTEDYMKMVENPLHGYGKLINPCIDCKIYFLRKASEIMHKENASFVATGEVVGQRPMSQMKHTLNHIEKETGLRGYLLRPLSAKLLRPTEAENDGIVNREKLLAINGRSRKEQIELANKYNISDYSSPAGGCQFTDKNMAKRVIDMFKYYPEYNMVDVYLLTIGRHYRLHDNVKIIVSRNENENLELMQFKEYADYIFMPDFRGPVIFVKGDLDDENLNIVGSIAKRYGKCDNDMWYIDIIQKDLNPRKLLITYKATDDLLNEIRI